MTAFEARKILIDVKRQLRQKNVFDAVNKALQALAWLEIQEREDLLEGEDLESGEDKEGND